MSDNLLKAVFDRLAGGNKFGKLSADYDVWDPESVDVTEINDVPKGVFTWTDGRRYKFTDFGGDVPGGVTPLTRQDFLDMFGDLPVVLSEEE